MWYPETQNGRANNKKRTCRGKARFQIAEIEVKPPDWDILILLGRATSDLTPV